MLGFEDSYEVCNCKKVTIEQIKNVIKTMVVTGVTGVTGCFLARKKNILSFRNKN